MSKTNFTKVEESLTVGLRKIEVDKLYKEAKPSSKPGEEPAATPPPTTLMTPERQSMRQGLKLTLKWLLKQDKGIYTKLKTTKKEADRLLGNPEALSDFDWEFIEMLATRAQQIKKDIKQKAGGVKGDEDLVNEQRTKHLTKRFNVNDKWLPLK